MPKKPFSNSISYQYRILPRKHPRSGDASRIYRGRSPYERCFAFITKDMEEGKQGRGGRGLTKLHTPRSRPPNTRCPKRGLQLDRGGAADGRSRRWGKRRTLPLLAGVIGHREYPERYSRLLQTLSSGGWTTESTAVGEHHKVEGARGASKGAATRIQGYRLAIGQVIPPNSLYWVRTAVHSQFRASFSSLSLSLLPLDSSLESLCLDSGRESSRMKREDVTIPTLFVAGEP